MIVKCPSCNSEFMVGNGVFQKAKSPLFHCNICNVFFRISANDIINESTSANTIIGAYTDTAQPAEIVQETATESTPENSAVEEIHTDAQNSQSQEDSAQEDSAPDSHGKIKHRIKKIFNIKKNTVRKIRSQTGVWVWDCKNKEASREPHLEKVSRYIDDVNFNLDADGIFIDQLIKQNVQSNRVKAVMHSGILKIISFLFVPYLTLATICYAARSYEDAPPLIASIMSFNKSSLPEIAPSSLEILHVEQNKVSSSRDGDDALTIVSGDIFNTDKYSFQNLFLELRTYDKHNRLLETSIIPLENELSTHKDFPNNIGHLDTAKIFSMQQKPVRDTDFRLRPNHVSRFQIVVSQENEKTYYFSVKVYSVKKTMNVV